MEIEISTNKKHELVNITKEINKTLRKLDIKEGICNIYVPHATAAIMINENADPNIALDINDALKEVVREGGWRHDRIDNNAAAHIKAAIIGPSQTIPVKNSELMLGEWQDVFLCDFDGPRKRRIIITTIPQ